jgi:hypothetical protein
MLVEATGKRSARVAAPAGGRAGKIAGYRGAGERHAKTRRLAQLTARLGGTRLWWARNNLVQANVGVQVWESLWTHRRMFLGADGESGNGSGTKPSVLTTPGNSASRSRPRPVPSSGRT